MNITYMCVLNHINFHYLSKYNLLKSSKSISI